MGTISRHAGAPFADGETLAGADLEGDFATVYDAVNGNIDAANLADGAVTTPKLAANAVTQAKMTSGAASASEATSDVTVGGVTLTGSFANIGSAVSHAVGTPARHVAIMVSFSIFATATSEIKIKMLKDAVNMTPNHVDTVTNLGASNMGVCVTRVYLDIAPTPGGTHSYQFQATATSGSPAIFNLMVFAFEPRS